LESASIRTWRCIFTSNQTVFATRFAWNLWQWNGVCALGASFFGGARTIIG
jgi:hypothetical protein